MKEYLKIARPDHWVKNIFIVPGIITALLLVENSWGFFLLSPLQSVFLQPV